MENIAIALCELTIQNEGIERTNMEEKSILSIG